MIASLLFLMNVLMNKRAEPKEETPVVEQLEDKAANKMLRAEIKKLREQLYLALKIGNQLSVKGMPLMSRNPLIKSDAFKEFNQASTQWWKFVGAVKGFKVIK